MSENAQSAQSDELRASEIPLGLQDKPLIAKDTSSQGSPESKVGIKPRKGPAVESQNATESVDSFASDVHGYIREYIQFADQKASFLFAGVAAMIAFLHAKGVTKLWLKDIGQWALPDAVAFIAVAGLLLGAILAVSAILPRLRGKSRGIVFWGAITRFKDGKEYATHVQQCAAENLAAAKLEHCHELAWVCQRKYRIVAWALWCGSIGLVASVVYLAFY